MYSLTQSLRIRGLAGDPLPSVFKALEDRGTRLLRGQLALVCAGPGVGKSSMVLTWAIKSRVPCVYFSADSDSDTQTSRAFSILSGLPLGSHRQGEQPSDLLSVPIRMVYDASPTLDTIDNTIESWFEGYEDYPALIVVDNITNVRGSSPEDDPFSGLEALMDYLHVMARETQACVVGLHHVTGGYNDASKAIPLSGVKGQIARVPELVLTMFRKPLDDDSDILCVSTVKNRGGKADPSGNGYAELLFHGPTMTIRDLRESDFASGLDSEPCVFSDYYTQGDPFNDY